MKMRAGLELLVTIFFVFILITYKNMAGLPLWIKYIYDVVEIIVILVAPGYFIQGLFFRDLFGSLLIIKFAIAITFSVSIWIILVYILYVFGIGLNSPEIFLVYAIFNVVLATLAMFRNEKTRIVIENQNEIEKVSRRGNRIGRILFISMEALLILGIIWLVGSIQAEALVQSGFTEFYFTREADIEYIWYEDSVDVFVPITIENQETVDAEYGIIAEYNQKVVGVVGSIRLVPGESWSGIVKANIKNKKQLVEVSFLLARGEASFPYRSLMLKFDNFMSKEDQDLDESIP